MKRVLKLITMFIICFSVALVFASCKTGPDFPYNDMVETPTDIPPLLDKDYVKYPEKPADLPTTQGQGVPTVGQATTASEFYKIEQANGKITIKFNEIKEWDYVYIPLNNFNKEYQNIKITATGTNIQKLTVSALYAEMHETGNPSVSVVNSDVGDTEQYYIMQLGKTKLLDKSYYPLEEVLGDKVVYGLCLFIDSNPSQNIVNKKTEIESVFEITSIEFLKDGDPSIKEVYVDPSINVGVYDAGYMLERDADKVYTVTKSASAGIYECATLQVSNYSSAYTTINMKFTTENVKHFTVELLFTGGLATWSENVTVYQSNVTDGEHEASIDFSTVEPYDIANNWAPAAGYYVKNYKIVGIKIYLDTILEGGLIAEDATCTISEIAFERVENQGTIIGKGWTSTTNYITVGDDLAAGGIGSIEQSWYNTWEFFSMPVAGYEPANKLVVKFQASEELKSVGIALGCNSSTGEIVLKTNYSDILDDTVELVEGVVETIEYDAENCIYTFTFDFTNAAVYDQGKKPNEFAVNSLRFYFTDVLGNDEFEGTRTIRFISVEFVPFEEVE